MSNLPTALGGFSRSPGSFRSLSVGLFAILEIGRKFPPDSSRGGPRAPGGRWLLGGNIYCLSPQCRSTLEYPLLFPSQHEFLLCQLYCPYFLFWRCGPVMERRYSSTYYSLFLTVVACAARLGVPSSYSVRLGGERERGGGKGGRGKEGEREREGEREGEGERGGGREGGSWGVKGIEGGRGTPRSPSRCQI